MADFKVDDRGDEVKSIQEALKGRGFDPGLFDGDFGPGTEAAVIAFQKSEGLAPDGIVGLKTLTALGITNVPQAKAFDIDKVTAGLVSRMFPQTQIGNINANLPFVLKALKAANLADKPMVLVALGTIRAETASFEPISEFISRFNTSPHGHPFDLYDYRKDLGNQGPPDGERFRGRGFVQLTGRFNFKKFGDEIGKDLVNHSELANDPETAATLLACFLKDKENNIRECLAEHDLRGARRAVNGGTDGLAEFIDAFNIGNRVLG